MTILSFKKRAVKSLSRGTLSHSSLVTSGKYKKRSGYKALLAMGVMERR